MLLVHFTVFIFSYFYVTEPFKEPTQLAWGKYSMVIHMYILFLCFFLFFFCEIILHCTISPGRSVCTNVCA